MTVAFMALRAMALGPWWPIVALSAGAWLLLAASDTALVLPSLCSAGVPVSLPLADALTATMSAGQAASWLLMLFAMVPPLLWQPLSHVWQNSLADRRLRGVLLFVAGYLGVWLGVMVVLQAAILLLRSATGSAGATFAIACAAAVAWQMTTVKLRYRRRCHILRPLPAFGLAAECASMRFGIELGTYCAGACWAIMLVPLAGDVARLPLMAAAGLFMLAERYSWPNDRGFRLA